MESPKPLGGATGGRMEHPVNGSVGREAPPVPRRE